MPKRRRESNEVRWKRKLEKYERKLAKKRRRVSHSSGDETIVQPQEQLDLVTEENENLELEIPTDINNQGDAQPGTSASVDAAVTVLTSQAPLLPHDTTPLEAPVPPAALLIDPDLLQALGDCHTDEPEWGNDVLNDISQRWEPILIGGLKKEIKEDLLKRYLLPKNVPSSKAPILNPELSAMLTEACRNRDTRLCTKQRQLGNTIAAIGEAMTGILTKTIETPEILKILNDAGKLLADSHYSETNTRRALITPLLDKSYISSFKDRKRDSFLFGDKLGDFIKSSRGMKKTGQLITPPAASSSATTSNLNGRGPPRQPRSSRAGAGRPGGQRLPPPPPRRAPPYQPRGARAPLPPTAYNRRHPSQSQTTSRSRNMTS